MARLRTFLVISLVCHLIVILILVDVRFSGRKLDDSEIYEVSIVSGPPAEGAPSSQVTGVPQGKKFIYRRGSQQVSLDEVTKEKALKDTLPKLSPSEIQPEKTNESGPDIPEAGSGVEGRGQLTRGPDGGSPSEVALWKARVRSVVETLWKSPPEIENMDMSLKTTYLLRVSRSGDLLQKKLLVSSGNVPFDRSVLIALNRVTRIPPPPLVLVVGEDWVEITMSFTPPKGAN
jgi:TonB family protein